MKKSRKAAFEPKTFLAKVGNGKTVTECHKNQVVFSQGSEADAVFYIQNGKIKLTVVFAVLRRAIEQLERTLSRLSR